MCSQTMMSSTETRQGFKVTKAFFRAPCSFASALVREELSRECDIGVGGAPSGSREAIDKNGSKYK